MVVSSEIRFFPWAMAHPYPNLDLCKNRVLRNLAIVERTDVVFPLLIADLFKTFIILNSHDLCTGSTGRLS